MHLICGVALMVCLLFSTLFEFKRSCRFLNKIAQMGIAIGGLPFLLAMTILRARYAGRNCSVTATPGCLYMNEYSNFMTWACILLWPFLLFGVLARIWCHHKGYDKEEV